MQILNFNGNVNGDYYYLAAFKKIYKNVTEQIVILLLSAAVIIHTVLCLHSTDYSEKKSVLNFKTVP